MELRLYNGETVEPYKIIENVNMLYTMIDRTLIYSVRGETETYYVSADEYRYIGVYPM